MYHAPASVCCHCIHACAFSRRLRYEHQNNIMRAVCVPTLKKLVYIAPLSIPFYATPSLPSKTVFTNSKLVLPWAPIVASLHRLLGYNVHRIRRMLLQARTFERTRSGRFYDTNAALLSWQSWRRIVMRITSTPPPALMAPALAP
jgi:hypothetical protein